MDFHFSHDFDIDVANYWKLFLAEPFNVDMYQALKMKKREVLKQEDDGKRFYRVTRFEPSTQLPSFLASLVKSTDYTEIDTLDWAKNAMEIVIETAMFKDKFKMRGMYTVSPIDGGNHVRREFKGEVKVSMPLIGGKIEKFMIEQMRESYEIASRVTRTWIAEKRPIA